MTPVALQRAQDGIEEIEQQESADPLKNASRKHQRVTAFESMAKEMKWTEDALKAFLLSEGFDCPVDKIPAKEFNRLYQRLLNHDLRDKFISSTQCEAASRS